MKKLFVICFSLFSLLSAQELKVDRNEAKLKVLALRQNSYKEVKRSRRDARRKRNMEKRPQQIKMKAKSK